MTIEEIRAYITDAVLGEVAAQEVIDSIVKIRTDELIVLIKAHKEMDLSNFKVTGIS